MLAACFATVGFYLQVINVKSTEIQRARNTFGNCALYCSTVVLYITRLEVLTMYKFSKFMFCNISRLVVEVFN